MSAIDVKLLLKSLEQVAALAQNGLAYSQGKFDLERYEQLRVLAAELMASVAALPTEPVRDWLALDSHYATPKIDVRAVVFRGEAVLLVQEHDDGCWALPGGWCDVGSSPGESAAREVREEAGLEVQATRLLALFDKQKHDYPPRLPHSYKCFILCEETGGELCQGTHETQAARFFALCELPPLSRGRITEAQLRRVVGLARDPGSDAGFD